MRTQSPQMMKCGHTANASSKDGSPLCIICEGIAPGATEIDSNPPSLDGRTAICNMCRQAVPSSHRLAFFECNIGICPTDGYYCGCRGWE